ncbi:MAG: hypothetical protein PHR65_03375 [Syntrophomonadaceae bacterium]|nr:hypothetical protein [Syntrophomonadaceae bacterium]
MPRRICPRCGSRNTATILRGMPAWSPELQEKMDKGEVVLGGCCITDCDPTHHCNKCKKDFCKPTDEMEARVKQIHFSLGGFHGGYHDLTIMKTEHAILARYLPPYGNPELVEYKKELSFNEWMGFLHDLFRCYITDWKQRYVDKSVLDGTQWELTFDFAEGKKLRRYGSNDYPPHWKKLLAVFKKYGFGKIE